MHDVLEGINEENLSDLCFDITDYVDRISTLFDTYDQNMEKLKSSYSCDASKVLYTKYDEMKQSFPIVKRNLKGYSDDLIALIQYLHENTTAWANTLDSAAESVLTKLKQVEKEG